MSSQTPIRARHISPSHFLRSAIAGSYLGIAGYWLAVYVVPTVHDLALFTTGRMGQ